MLLLKFPLWAPIAATGAVGTTVIGGAAVGAGTDLISEYSQDDNAMGELKHFPQLDNLATKDTDSPAMKTFKNVVEGMGIGILFDGIFALTKGALKGVRGSADEITKVLASEMLTLMNK